jgi:antitoxin HicB
MSDYPAVFTRERGTVLVEFPDFPEAHTYGNDVEEARARARDALATIIDAYIQDRQPIPQPSPFMAGTYRVSLPALTQAKVDLYNTMRESDVTKSDLARRLGCHLPQVDRLLDVHHASRLDQLERAFNALGKEMYIGVMPLESARQQRISAAARRRAAAKGRGMTRETTKRKTVRRATTSRRKTKRS